MFNRRRSYSYSSYSRNRLFSRRGGYGRGYGRGPRIRWERVGIIVAAVVVVVAVLLWFNFSRIELMFKGYSFSEQSQILDLNDEAVDEILSHDKMDNISKWIEKSENVKYYDEYERYLSIHNDLKAEEVVEMINDYFDNYIPKIQTLNYSEEQIWEILETADKTDLEYLINHNYSYAQIKPYMQVKGFVYTDLEEYMNVYATSQNYNYAVLVTTYPFIISSNDVDTTYTIQNVDDVSILVKPGFTLPSSYVPKDLKKADDIPVAPDCNNYQLRSEAADALTKMYNAAKEQGYYLVVNSAYRSYNQQQETYDEYFRRYDEVTASGLVAKPGTSEHQTGLGVDLTSQSVLDGERLVFGDTVEYQWCKQNSYKYGFILRFEEDKSDITGIAHEPWHFRYVGVEAAEECYKNAWTYEEYCLNKGVIPTLKAN